jgi:hypothetical protein
MKSADRAFEVAARFDSRGALPAGLPMEWSCMKCICFENA